jgi:hypothetical protein
MALVPAADAVGWYLARRMRWPKKPAANCGRAVGLKPAGLAALISSIKIAPLPDLSRHRVEAQGVCHRQTAIGKSTQWSLAAWTNAADHHNTALQPRL